MFKMNTGGEIKRRGLKLETFYIEIKKDIVKNDEKNDIILKEESKRGECKWHLKSNKDLVNIPSLVKGSANRII